MFGKYVLSSCPVTKVLICIISKNHTFHQSTSAKLK